jgi:hypothetical protein
VTRSGQHALINAADDRSCVYPHGDGLVMAAALRHAMRGSLSVDEAAIDLARLARDRAFFDQAIARLNSGQASQPTSVGRYAHEALIRARAIASHPARPSVPDVTYA